MRRTVAREQIVNGSRKSIVDANRWNLGNSRCSELMDKLHYLRLYRIKLLKMDYRWQRQRDEWLVTGAVGRIKLTVEWSTLKSNVSAHYARSFGLLPTSFRFWNLQSRSDHSTKRICFFFSTHKYPCIIMHLTNL